LSQCATTVMTIDEQETWRALVASLEQGLCQEGELEGAEVALDLLAHFLCIPDQRRPEWVIHPLAAVLALAAGAVVAGWHRRGRPCCGGWSAALTPMPWT
jgi:hypothetical protein